ncbi:MAG: sigma-54 dependent transcriptional regulator [Longimicrobiales bacterium]
MLVRTLLHVRPESERERVNALLDRRTLVVVEADDRPPDASDVDLVFVSGAGVDGDLVEWVARTQQGEAPPAVVCLTSDEDPSRRAAMLALGCLAVLNLRLSDRELRSALQTVVRRAVDQVRVRVTAERTRPDPAEDALVAASAAMRDSLDLCRRIAPADTSVLLLGETGVGKERLARNVHRWSHRSGGPFVAVNCGAIPEGLLESELFGHERGAFTGAVKGRRGHFEMAHGGTLFLDEIGELPLSLQVKLLRALDQRRIQPLGSEVSMPVDIRLIAATHRVLEQEVEAGRFRADLYYRLAVISIAVPPLRSRPEDVRALVDHYVARIARGLGRPVPTVDEGAHTALEAYHWPGNVRELMNVLERAVLLSTDRRIGRADLPAAIAGVPAPPPNDTEAPQATASAASTVVTDPADDQPLREARRAAARAFERDYLSRLLTGTEGRVGEAARRAGVNPRTFYDLVRRHGLRKEDFRPSGASPAADRG